MFLFRKSQKRVSVDEAQAITGGDQSDAVLLDVREKDEWKSGHAPDAVHAPLTGLVTGAALPATAQGRALVVICRSGHRSQQAAKLLAERGADAVDVEGGMNAWAAAGYPVVDERGNNGSIA
ncbi:rhodanese-like domain-containing protein [Streptomyces globisporus]|uniref:rhodanese-like domain-containing protein n=1 Tax=Streptomyces TaxID=1883 RepID=UPI0015CF018F|nr:rhodanese-like domain-containing protein [Streptomyces sp. st170]WSF77516.1 rhodanese-like domain-containing protein [Streptomyces globisporus]WSV90598.1 rhodanese-like domain-containing protein [Streptomyces globisporus]